MRALQGLAGGGVGLKTVFISAPSKLTEQPSAWSHDLAVELAVEEEKGYPVGCIDNAFYRLDVEVLRNSIKKLEPDRIVIYGGLRQYRFIKEYLGAFPEAKVMGFPKDILNIPVEDGVVPPEEPDGLPYPAWHFLPIEDYFRNSALPYTQETVVERRAVFKGQWGEVEQSPDYVADALRYLKLVWNYDFIAFEDDFTRNKERTYKLIEELEDRDMIGLFGWSCGGNTKNIDRDLLKAMREARCAFVDFGEIDAMDTRDEATMERMQAAVNSSRAAEIFPVIRATIGHPETGRDDLVELLKFLKINNLDTRPEILEPYPGTPLFEKIKDRVDDVEEHILNINDGFLNFTSWTDEELLGIVELTATGDIARIEKVRNPH